MYSLQHYVKISQGEVLPRTHLLVVRWPPRGNLPELQKSRLTDRAFPIIFFPFSPRFNPAISISFLSISSLGLSSIPLLTCIPIFSHDFGIHTKPMLFTLSSQVLLPEGGISPEWLPETSGWFISNHLSLVTDK